MEYESYDLNDLYRLLPEYVNSITEKRKYKKYNCPLCNSGARENGTPAFNLYDDNLKCHCFSCGFDGNIIGLYLAVNDMADTKENIAVAIRALGKSFRLIPQYRTAPAKTKATQPKTEISRREHIYHNADGSVFGKKVIPKYSDGSKGGIWYLFNPNTQQFHTKSGLNGQKAPLYHADRLHQDTDSLVFFVEGEKDVETLESILDCAGEALATSTPNGAGQTAWPDLYNADLSGREIIVITDNDEAGEKYGSTVAKNLCKIAKSVKIVPTKSFWPDCPEKADISDAVQALGADETSERLSEAIQKAQIYTPELDKPEQSADQTKRKYNWTTLDKITPEKREFLWNPYIPIGEITVMFAAGGTGKSFATVGIAADVSAGRTLPKDGAESTSTEPQKVIFISAEDSPEIIRSRMQEIGGKPENCIVLKTPKNRHELNEESFLLPQDKDDKARIEMFAELLEEVRPKLVIIDPWSVYLGSDKNMNKANDVRGVTTVLTTLAKEFDCAILIVAHVNKMPQMENANNAVSGSTALIDAARSAICVRSFGADTDRRVMIQTKANYSRKGRAICYRIIDQGEGRTARFAWDGFCDLTEDDLTSAAYSGKKLTDIVAEKEDEEEYKKIAIEIIKSLAITGKSISISYNRFRNELISKYGEDILPNRPQKFMNSLASSLRSCGIKLELKMVKGVNSDNSTDSKNSRGFVIHCIDSGNLMAQAMPY